MACYHPQTVYCREVVDGKKKLYFPKISDDLTRESFIDLDGHLWKRIKIPCKKCVGCRLAYSSEWATRGFLEMKDHPLGSCWFFTLTYDDFHLAFPFAPLDASDPVAYADKYEPCFRSHVNFDKETGEVLSEDVVSSLIPDHLKKFMKDFREFWRINYNVDGIRFMACGEYGDKNERPHFHVIVFGCPFPPGELQVYKTNFQGDVYYTSDVINRLWKNGYCVIAENSWETIAYVARYVMKKVSGKGSFIYDLKGICPEFFRMSRRPGIARKYFDEHGSLIYETDHIVVPGKNGAKSLPVPKYFDRLFVELFPDSNLLQTVKEKRSLNAELRQQFLLKKTSIDEVSYLAVQEANITNRIKSLDRTKV